MRGTDISIDSANVEFRKITLAHPLTIAPGSVGEFTLATVHLQAVNNNGDAATGRGASVLSIPWSWPRGSSAVNHRNQVLTGLVSRIADQVVDLAPDDPIGIWRTLYDDLDHLIDETADNMALGEKVPHLAAMLALGAVDNAVHDAWSRAAGKPAPAMYTGQHLNHDLADILGTDFADRYPGDFLAPGRRSLPIQHVVGVTDPLTPTEVTTGQRSLADWLRTEQPHFIKIKILGENPDDDAARVVAIHDIAQRINGHPSDQRTLAIDPNESYESPYAVIDLMEAIYAKSPKTADKIGYIEQPIPRDTPADPALLRTITDRVPVIIDEGLSRLESLSTLSDSGWAGAVIKAAKGQTFALLVHAYVHVKKLSVTFQDLTAVDLALRHSARLASVLVCSAPHFEYNSRQYAPHANTDLRASLPGLVNVIDGHITVGAPEPGLY